MQHNAASQPVIDTIQLRAVYMWVIITIPRKIFSAYKKENKFEKKMKIGEKNITWKAVR